MLDQVYSKGSVNRGGTENSTEAISVEETIALERFRNEWPSMHHPSEISGLQEYYFTTYSNLGIHEEMLKDSVRTGAYKKAMVDNAHLFKDKVVLDIGTGTGILSLFAAKAGAAKVYALECSDIAVVAQDVINANGYGSVIEIIRGKAEEVTLPVDQVDIIVSEWMGYFLLYESVLDTVIYCRDKWLKKDTGMIFPDKAELYISAIEDADYKEEKIGFWRNIFGFDYSAVQKYALEEPIVDVVESKAIVATHHPFKTIDLYTCTVNDLEFASTFNVKLTRNDHVHAFIVWFDVLFMQCHRPIRLTTSPHEKTTHWKQCVLYMKNEILGYSNEQIKGEIAVRKSPTNAREIDIKIHYKFEGSRTFVDDTHHYRLR